MESLNDIVQRYVQMNEELFRKKAISIDLELDPAMPVVYQDFSRGTPVNRAIAQLSLEFEDAKPTNELYQTSFERGLQILTISHNGKPISPDTIAYLSGFLAEISDGKREWPYMTSGNLIAAQALKSIGGRISLKNVCENG